jgi:hypothetical protein
MLCQYYVAKSSEEQKKKNMKNEKNYDKQEKKKERKLEGNKIKVKKIIKILLGSFCFKSFQVP